MSAIDSTRKPTKTMREIAEEQHEYHEDRSSSAKKLLQASKVAIQIITVMIAVAAATNTPRPVIILLTGTIGSIGALEGIFNWHERWTNSRKTAEVLRIQNMLYDNGCGPYSNPDTKKEVFSRRLTEILGDELSRWELAQEGRERDVVPKPEEP
jgi:hypothetical protein